MNDLLEQVLEEIRSAWRFRWFGLAVAVLVAAGGWLFVFSMPDRYVGTASVFVDTRTALKPILKGMIVESDVMSQVGYVRQSILSGARLETLATEAGIIGTAPLDPPRKTEILADFSKRVSVDAKQASADAYQSSGTVYTITYPDDDRGRAIKVTSVVLDTFIREALGGKQQESESAQKFLAVQIKDYEDRLKMAENGLAEFKKRNLGLMPTDHGDYFSRLQAETDAAKQMQNDLDVAQVRKSELAQQLRGESVINSSALMAQGVGADTAARIREAQARLDELLLRFTDKHPDVAEARNSLTELKVRRQTEIESLRRGDAGAAAASGLANNPVYQNIQLQLNQADVEIAALRGQVIQHNAKAAELRKLLDTAPKVEAEYTQLNRDYDNNKSLYGALLANYEKARLGEKVDDADGVPFHIVQPAIAHLAAASSYRNLLLVGVLGAALLAGGAFSYLLQMARPVIHSSRELSQLTGLSVLGVVSVAFPHRLHAQARVATLAFSLATGVLLACFVVVMNLSWNGFRLATVAVGVGAP